MPCDVTCGPSLVGPSDYMTYSVDAVSTVMLLSLMMES
jgi:hypothetical protein